MKPRHTLICAAMISMVGVACSKSHLLDDPLAPGSVASDAPGANSQDSAAAASAAAGDDAENPANAVGEPGDGGTSIFGPGDVPDEPDDVGTTASEDPVRVPVLASSEPLCAQYLDLWISSESQLAPGEPEPPWGAPSACLDCVSSPDGCERPPSSCDPGSACVRRHCLCTDDWGACQEESYTDDLCSCIEDCFPPGEVECIGHWERYMRCTADECSQACD